MKKIFKKGMSGLLAFLMCFTTILSIGVTPAFAASETCTTYSIGFPRDGDANQVYSNEAWGHPALTHMNGWYSNDVDMTTIHCMNGYDGQVVYCIEPAIHREMGETMNGFGEDFWDNYPSNLNNTIQPDDIKLLLGRILQYGYHGNLSTSWRSQNADDADKIAHVYATQILVWETIVGERDANFNHVSTGSYDPIKSVLRSGHPLYSQICAYYDSIVASVQSHTIIPSFMKKSAGSAQEIELEWNGSEYTATLTDTNNILSKYSFTANVTGMNFSVSGNKLTITTATAPEDTVTITATKSQTRSGVITWSDGTHQGGHQDTVTYSASVSDPVKAFLKPFVLATTSIGQEGLDFHNYCRRIMHWNLPGNPIDLEQREGRINRFKCLAIRQNVAEKYGSIHFYDDIWKEMFEAAEAEKASSQSDLVPYWCFGKDQSIKIERIVPMYPMSKDEITYERLIKILSLYRLTLGQARQEELLEYLFHECKNPEELKKLFIDLSPFSKEGYSDEKPEDIIHESEAIDARETTKMKKLSGKEILIERAIQAYIKDFDRNNQPDGSSQRNETIKWTAAANFAVNWDVDADDMLSMWKRCTKGAFIDTQHNHPSQGITLLLKIPSEVEGVRKAFRGLFIEETGDPEEKWNRVLAFMDYINGRIAEFYPNSSVYLQTKEAVLTYLNLWDPDHNYRYKPASANNWASYMGYIDWESGQRFSLRKYYRMCDEIQEVVKNHEELLRVHRQRFENGEPDYDKEFHILTFDVLYCFWSYEDARREALEEYKEAMKQQQIDDLEEQLSQINTEIKAKEGLIGTPNCVGIKVRHKKYGIGEVAGTANGKVTVLFENEGPKQFLYPDAFEKGFLHPEDQVFMDQIQLNKDLEDSLSELKIKAAALSEKLSMLDIKPE